MSEERITYDEFMTMFKFAPKICYTLYDKAEDKIDRLNNIINELEKIINYEIQEWKDTDNELMKARVQEDKYILEVIEELKEE